MKRQSQTVHQTQRSREFRKNLTEEEVMLWAHLQVYRKKGFAFRRQAPIGRYFADFLCRKSMLVVEVDGWHHDLPERMARGAVRDEWLIAQGYRVIRIPAGDVRHDLPNIERQIDAALGLLHAR